jgi:hypothetical protein
MERRRARRFTLGIPVIFHWVDERQMPCGGAGFSRDISIHGLFVFTPAAAPPLASQVELTVLLPSLAANGPGLHLHAKGSVVRLYRTGEGPGVGIASALGDFEDCTALSLRENKAEIAYPLQAVNGS